MIKEISSWIVIGTFVCWFVLTIFHQNRKWRKLVSFIVNRDIYSLVPIWTFFAPNPGRSDLYLLYRDRDEEGQISPWREIKMPSRKSWLSLWSPKRRIGKGIVDLSPEFTKGTGFQPKEPVGKKQVLGFPYLLILNYVCSRPIDFRAHMRQFAIAKTEGHGTEGNPVVIFLSAFHVLDHIT